jgi:hypothetical protein
MGCYLEDYRARMGIWTAKTTLAAITSWATRTSRRRIQGKGRVIFYLRTMIPCATTLAVLLVIVGGEKNPAPGVEAEKILQVLCSGRDINLKSGTQCNTCRRWFHNAVVMLKLKWRRAGNGSVISVDRRDSGC